MESKYRSKEELYFSWWLDELVEAGYVESYEYEPYSIELIKLVKYRWEKKLKTKSKEMESTLLQGLSYTPDFEIRWSEECFYNSNCPKILWFNSGKTMKSGIYAKHSKDNCGDIFAVSLVDVKGEFDRNKSNSTFSIIQKVVYDSTNGVYIEKVVPKKLFANTFTPKRYLVTDKSGKARKIKWKVKTLGEYIDDE